MTGPPSNWDVLPEGWTWADVGHGALDIGGLVPVAGEGADLVNAAWYAAEGNYLEAGLSLISMVPVVGDAVGKGAKLAKKGAGKLAGPAVDALRKMDFAAVLKPLADHPQLGKHADKIVEALEKWRSDISLKAHGISPCPCASRPLRQAGAMIGNTPVPTRILEKLTSDQLKIFKDAIARVEGMPVPREGHAVFYSGKIGKTYAWKAAEDAAKAGKWDSVNTLTSDLLNADNIRQSLPRDAMEFVDNLASKRLAATAAGDIRFFGDVTTISPNSVFRQVELPALLNNPNISRESQLELLNMKYFLDSKYGK